MEHPVAVPQLTWTAGLVLKVNETDERLRALEKKFSTNAVPEVASMDALTIPGIPKGIVKLCELMVFGTPGTGMSIVPASTIVPARLPDCRKSFGTLNVACVVLAAIEKGTTFPPVENCTKGSSIPTAGFGTNVKVSFPVRS